MRSHHEENQTRFYVCFAIAISSTIGIAFSANLFTLFIFYEVLTLSTYPLVTHSGTEKAKIAGRVYLSILLGTSIVFFLLAIVSTWLVAGTLDFKPGGVFDADVNTMVAGTILVLFVFGIGKAAYYAISSLVTGSNGGADTSERIAACGRSRQSRCIHRLKKYLCISSALICCRYYLAHSFCSIWLVHQYYWPHWWLCARTI